MSATTNHSQPKQETNWWENQSEKRAAIRFEMAPHWAKKWRTPWTKMRETRFTCATQSQSCNRAYERERRRDCTSVVETTGMECVKNCHNRCTLQAVHHSMQHKKSFASWNRAPFKRQRKTRDIDCTSVILEWIHRHACNMRMRYASISYFFWVRIKSALWGFIPR